MAESYESLLERARQTSLTAGYSAVVEIVTYRTGQSRRTVCSGSTPIRTVARGGEFRGVVAQYRKGEPCQ